MMHLPNITMLLLPHFITNSLLCLPRRRLTHWQPQLQLSYSTFRERYSPTNLDSCCWAKVVCDELVVLYIAEESVVTTGGAAV